MKCKYITVNNGHDYPMPNEEEDKLIKKLMEELADKYEVTSLKLSPEYIEENEYVFTFQIPEKYNSKECLEIWDKLIEEKDNFANKHDKKHLISKYSINLKR